MVRVTVAGPELEGLTVDLPAASVRLLLPVPGQPLVVPTWNGNEFLLPDGSRPTIRTFTPRHVGDDGVDLDIVVHDGGVASAWAEAAEPGDPAALAGPGRGYAVDPDAPAFLLAGDEAAIPAISQLLELLPVGTPAQVQIEVAHADARLELPDRGGTIVEWSVRPDDAEPGEALVAAVCGTALVPGTRVWVGGEAAAMQRIRRHLFQELGMPRTQATVRGYWKHGRSGDDDGEGET
jgi:NADPH-dependent ferric siderophore reductase